MNLRGSVVSHESLQGPLSNMSQPAGFDRRRINGPEESKPPILEPLGTAPSSSDVRKGRKPADIRPICTPDPIPALWHALIVATSLVSLENRFD